MLSIELESEPISGRVSTEDGPSRRFSGWIELVEAIEAARCAAPVALGGLKTLGSDPGAKLAGM
jgi:hypothetical protein